MSHLNPGSSAGNFISAGATQLIRTLCLLLWVSTAARADGFSRFALSSTPLVALQAASTQPRQKEDRELKPGDVIERELAGGEAHVYRIVLTSGQYLNVAVEQKGINVVVKLFGIDGRELAHVNNGPAVGIEAASLVAEASGQYTLEVRSENKGENAGVEVGRYEITVSELRAATSNDRIQVAAQKALGEANLLSDQRTSDSRRQALAKYEEALPLWRLAGDRWGEVRTLNEAAIIYTILGESQKAEAYFSQALPLTRAIGDRQSEAATLSSMGNLYWRQGKSQEALQYYAQALPLLRETGDHWGEAATLNNIGTAYHLLGQLTEALEYYNRTLPLRRAFGDARGEADTLNNIAALYAQAGELQKALEHHQQVLPMRTAMKDLSGEAYTRNNLGNIYNQLGVPQKGLAYKHQALLLMRASGDRQGEIILLQGLGAIYRESGELEKALEYASQALAQSRAMGDRRMESYALNEIGRVHQRSGNPQKALEHFNEALPLSRAVGDRRGETNTLINLGGSYIASGAFQKALEHYRLALQLSRELGNRLYESASRYGAARAQSRLGELLEADAQVQAAIGLIESIRTKVASQELRSSFLASNHDLYALHVDLLMQMHRKQPSAGHDAAALQASERARARSLVELLTESRADIRQGAEPELLERARSLQQQLNLKSERLTRLLGGKHTEEQKKTATEEVEALLQNYHDVEAEIRIKSPRYAALTQPQPLSLQEIQRQVLDEDTLLLEYSLGEERSYLWAVTSGSITSFVLPKRAEIEAAARRAYGVLVARAEALYPEALTNLSQILLKPVAGQLGRKRLLIVSEGALQYVPFGALPVPSASDRLSAASGKATRYTPLISGHEIVSLPSASVLAVLRREGGTRKPAPLTLAVLADPVFDQNDPRVSKAKRQSGDEANGMQREGDDGSSPSDVERSIRESGLNRFDRLLLSRREAMLITGLAAKEQSLAALDFAASRATATGSELSRYRIVHFATHSLLNNEHSELSGIVLSLVDEKGQPQDGFLRLFEVYNLKLEADLVVLSACQTALGEEIRAEGLVGLTRGFMHAGAPRVVASLWKVSDQATAELMARFYRNMLKRGLRPAAALRAAQESMSKEKQWAAPYYWAGFVLQGEWR